MHMACTIVEAMPKLILLSMSEPNAHVSEYFKKGRSLRLAAQVSRKKDEKSFARSR